MLLDAGCVPSCWSVTTTSDGHAEEGDPVIVVDGRRFLGPTANESAIVDVLKQGKHRNKLATQSGIVKLLSQRVKLHDIYNAMQRHGGAKKSVVSGMTVIHRSLVPGEACKGSCQLDAGAALQMFPRKGQAAGKLRQLVKVAQELGLPRTGDWRSSLKTCFFNYLDPYIHGEHAGGLLPTGDAACIILPTTTNSFNGTCRRIW